jgi:threonine/homoserine/homoserine lactone efflux protein
VEPSAALLAGLAAGLAIAMQVGAVSLLLVEAAVVAGPRAAVAAGMGVATIDFAFAVVAAAAGGAASAALSGHEDAIRLGAAGALAAIAIHGLIALRADDAIAPDPSEAHPGGTAGSLYARFVAITAVNPLTIASFAAIAASLSIGGFRAAGAFALGVGLASGAWHVALTLAAGHAGRWITPRIRRGLAIGGRVAVLAIAAHLALAAF